MNFNFLDKFFSCSSFAKFLARIIMDLWCLFTYDLVRPGRYSWSCFLYIKMGSADLAQFPLDPLSIQPVVVVRGLKRQQAAALTNYVGCFLLTLSYFFFLSPPSVCTE